MKRAIDLRFADWLIRHLKSYKRKRNESIANKNWNILFKNDLKKIHKLEENLYINIYKDSVLCRYIYNGFEADETIFLKKILNAGDLVIDVGANIGMFSLYAASEVGENGKVISFEPTPETFKRLNENIELNHFKNIIPANMGLSHVKGSLDLHVSEDGRDGWNTFASKGTSSFAKTIKVPVDTLDNFIREKNIDISKLRFLKIDVEGWEIPVLRGAQNLVSDNDNIIMMVEFTESNSVNAGFKIADLYDLIVSYGYKLYTYDANNNKLTFDPKRTNYPYVNLFAVKNVDEINLLLSNAK